MATFCSEGCRDIGSTCNFCLHFKSTSIGSSDGICGITNQEVDRSDGYNCDFFICFVTKITGLKERENET